MSQNQNDLFYVDEIEALTARVMQLEHKQINCIISGVLYDFMGFLTTRKQPITLSVKHDASAARELLTEFLKLRRIQKTEPLLDWENECVRDKETKSE